MPLQTDDIAVSFLSVGSIKGGRMRLKDRKSIKYMAISLMLLFSLNAGNFALAANTDSIQPMYVGVVSLFPHVKVTSAGLVVCTDTVTLKNGYSADVTWELNYGAGGNFSNRSTWTASGSRNISLYKERYAVRGYSYQLKTSAKVYDSSKNYVETVVKYSPVVSY